MATQQLRTYERNTQIKQTCAREFRLSASDVPGTWQGYGNVKGYLDTHGTIMFGQCYAEGIPALLERGFVPDAHGAAYGYNYPNAAVVGYFTNAIDDENGLWLEAVWHTDEKSQALRTKLLERQGAGKTSGLSIGFFIGDSIHDPVMGVDYIRIMPNDYITEIPKYSKPEYVSANLERAKGLPCVDILLRVTVFECSPTLIPSNEASMISQVRGAGKKVRYQARGRKNKIQTENNEAVNKQSLSIYTNDNTTMGFHHNDDDDDMRLKRKLDDADEVHDKLVKAMKRGAEHHDECRDALSDAMKHARKLAKHLDDIRDARKNDDDDDKRDDDDSRKRAYDLVQSLLRANPSA